MTISKEKEAEILRLYYAEKWKVGTIARQLSTHHKAIERVLFNHGVAAETLHARPSKVDPYLPFMLSTLEKYPKLSAAALYHMVSQRGYEGNIDHFRHVVAHYRPQPKAEAYLRVRTMPGEQGQVDWAHFGRIQIGKAMRRLMAFVMVLSWSRRVAQAYESEKPKLLPLPEVPHVTDERTQVHVGKTPYARFDLNDYSVPHKLVGKTLTVSANLETVRIIDGQQVVAQHPRSFDKGQQIENPEHIQELVEFKRQARQHRGMDRLHHAVASSTEILSVAAQRGYRLGGFTKSLLQLLDLYGAAELEEAIKAALPAGTIHIKAIREILEQRRKEKNLPPPVEIALPNDPRLTNVVVTPHSLDLYDDLHTHKE